MVLGPKNALNPPNRWPITKTALIKDTIEEETKSKLTKKNTDAAIKFNLKPKLGMEKKKTGNIHTT